MRTELSCPGVSLSPLMCRLWTSACRYTITHPQNSLDPRTGSGSIAHEKLQTWTDADPIPLVYLATLFFEPC